MIQELLGATTAGLIGGERKISTPGVLDPSPSPSPSPSSSATSASENQNQNLRCPRCDSSNTKFCYYNNYNLTQPRHFCKTCRRYWTKGGALRNVPIGGGCRKNKNATISTTPVGKSSSAGKLRTSTSSEIGKKSGPISGFDRHELLPSNPILWASPQNSHLLTLLRSTQNPNPNPNNSYPSPMSNSNSLPAKGENGGFNVLTDHQAVNGRTLGWESLSQGLCGSFWRNNNQQYNGLILGGEVQNTGLHEFYQRLRSPAANYNPDPMVLGNVAVSSSTSNSAAILESAPVTAGEMNYWNNPTLSWSDLSTTNGAYP